MSLLNTCLVAIFVVVSVYVVGWCLGGGTIFLTVFSGVLVYVLGQIIVKIVIDPVQEMKKTIGQISHSLIMSANVISNPGISKPEVMHETSRHLRELSSKLHSHLKLVPKYEYVRKIFSLPSESNVRSASSALIALSNGVFTATSGIYEQNAKKVEVVCDSLDIYLPEDQRWPK